LSTLVLTGEAASKCPSRWIELVEIMINFLAASLVIIGAGLLVGSLIPTRKLIAQLAPGPLRNRWYILTALIVFFIAGYLIYTAAFWSRHKDWLDLIVPGVFFFGAIFVWMISTLSLQTAIDLRRVILLEQENITDVLTGVYNRRYLDRRLKEESARAQRHALPLSLLLMDVDHFKRVNDTYGHQAGDQVLSYLGKLTLDAVRTSDVVTRYGGEEFMIIAPDTPLTSAGALAERLRQHVESHALVLTSESSQPQEIYITISIGVAGFDPKVDNPQTLMHQADEAVYRAKQEGRNRVVINNVRISKSTES